MSNYPALSGEDRDAEHLRARVSHSFVVRVWLEDADDEAGRALWRGHITHVLDGERVYFQNPRKLMAFLGEYVEEWNS